MVNCTYHYLTIYYTNNNNKNILYVKYYNISHKKFYYVYNDTINSYHYIYFINMLYLYVIKYLLHKNT